MWYINDKFVFNLVDDLHLCLVFYIYRIDCVGILKLRNADVEQRIGPNRSKKKSTKTRMVFRVNIPNPDGTSKTLQVASISISCSKCCSHTCCNLVDFE